MSRYLLAIMSCLFLVFFPAKSQEVPEYEVKHIIGRGFVIDIEWQANNARFIVSSGTGLWLYNASFELERTLTVPEEALASADFGYNNIEWSPDGETLAIGTDNGIWLWDAQLDSFHMLGNERSAYSFRWSPNGELIAFSDDDGNVHVVDVASGGELAVWDAAHYQIAWNFDGTQLLGIDRQDERSHLVVWDTVNFEEMAELRTDIAVGKVSWHPSRNIVGIDAEELILWQVDDDEQSIFPISRNDELLTFEWHPDGQSLAIGTDRHLLINNMDSSEQLSFDYRQGVRQLVWSPQGDRLALSLENEPNQNVQILNTSNWQVEWELSHPARPSTILWDASGQYLLTKTSHRSDSAVRGWDVRTGELVNTIYEHFNVSDERNVAWSADSSEIVINPASNSFAYIVDAQTSDVLDVIRTENPISSLDWNIQSGLIALISHEPGHDPQRLYQIIIWNPQSRSEVTRLEGHGHVWQAKWNPDGTHLALLFGINDGLVLWDISKPESQILLEASETYRIDALDWSPDGTQLVLASTPFEGVEGFDVFDVSDGHLVLELASGDEPRGLWPRNVAWSPSGDIITGAITDLGGRGTQLFWDIRSGEIVAGRGYGSAIDWHPSGAYVALNINADDAGQGDPQLIYLVNPYTNDTEAVLEAHEREIRLLLWSPDGRKLLSSDSNNLGFIWEQVD